MALALRLPDLLLDAIRRADDRLLTGALRAVSVSTERERARLRAAGRPFADPEAAEPVALEALDRTADWQIDRAASRAAALSGATGLAGALGVPPEAAATVLAAVRLGQRLAVVYGFDPHTDRGRMVLWRALAAGFEIELPEGGRVGMRASELPAVVAPRWIRPRTVGTELTGRMLRRAARMATPGRALPTLDGASRAPLRAIGERMRDVLRRLSDAPGASAPPPEDAREV